MTEIQVCYLLTLLSLFCNAISFFCIGSIQIQVEALMADMPKCAACGEIAEGHNTFDWPAELKGRVFCNECVRSKRYREVK